MPVRGGDACRRMRLAFGALRLRPSSETPEVSPFAKASEDKLAFLSITAEAALSALAAFLTDQVRP
jgi:hypothetical protein